MKVKIGKYVKFCGPYEIAQKIFFWLESWDPMVERFGDLLCKIPGLFELSNWIYEKRNRKISIKIHDHDSLDTFTTLAHVILPVLKNYRENYQGCPSEVFDYDLSDEDNFQNWRNIVTAMINSFEEIMEDGAYYNDEVQEGLDLFAKYYFCLWR
jgi:hypothetical protein